MTNLLVQSQITAVKEATHRSNRKSSLLHKKFKKDIIKESKMVKHEQVILDIMKQK